MTLQEIVDQLKKCGYECEGGRLEDNAAFRELEAMCQAESVSPFEVLEIVKRYWQATMLNLEVPNRQELPFDYLAGGIAALTQIQELLKGGEVTREKVEIFK